MATDGERLRVCPKSRFTTKSQTIRRSRAQRASLAACTCVCVAPSAVYASSCVVACAKFAAAGRIDCTIASHPLQYRKQGRSKHACASTAASLHLFGSQRIRACKQPSESASHRRDARRAPTAREAPPAQRSMHRRTDTTSSRNRLRQGHCKAPLGGPIAVKGLRRRLQATSNQRKHETQGRDRRVGPLRSEDASRHADRLWGNVKEALPDRRVVDEFGRRRALVERRRPRDGLRDALYRRRVARQGRRAGEVLDERLADGRRCAAQISTPHASARWNRFADSMAFRLTEVFAITHRLIPRSRRTSSFL